MANLDSSPKGSEDKKDSFGSSILNGHTKNADNKTETLDPNSLNMNGQSGDVKKKSNRPRRNGPNYAQIHSKPLPLSTHPLPAFHPTQPISLLRLAYFFFSQWWNPPTSHTQIFTGHFSSNTRSVHITDPQEIRALWEMGFFGKGTLSRSEPTWMEREKARIMTSRVGGRTAEEATNARRQERKLFKLERARAEREKIERQRLFEEGKIDASELEAENKKADEVITQDQLAENVNNNGILQEGLPPNIRVVSNSKDSISLSNTAERTENDEDDLALEIINQEHLQLTLEEAFFLSYALGVLQISTPPQNSTESRKDLPRSDLLHLFCQHGFFPPKPPSRPLAPDDQFLLNYVVYHHFRSLGWVVRSGIKFAVDYLLYNRGPVFSHAEFAVVIWPSYSDAYWDSEEGLARRRVKGERDWWWLHCVNRVQSQVRKSLVLVYVDVPALKGPWDGDIGGLLRRYRVREFVVKRWLANRSRD